MADRKTHKLIGVGSGAVYASFRSRNEAPNDWLIEILGGAFGGYLGGILPDELEPALSSWHRGVCHSWAAGSVVVATANQFAGWAELCRQNANKLKAMQTVQDETGTYVAVPITFMQQMRELFWRFLAGLLNGIVAGYTSHLILDAATPRGLPMLGLS